jgi:GH15 family glucan-1,4-alpha-glucosidase
MSAVFGSTMRARHTHVTKTVHIRHVCAFPILTTRNRRTVRRPTRTDGYAAIGDYALIGDGRGAALVALDGSIDWLCLPELDAPPVLAALLDPERGGSFELQPTTTFGVERRYADDSNVLETVFATKDGAVRVRDAFGMDEGALVPWRELIRQVTCVSGRVELRFRLTPRPRWAAADATFRDDQGAGIAEWDEDALILCSHGAGEVKRRGDAFEGRFALENGESALLVLQHYRDEPYALPTRSELELRLESTNTYWADYTRGIPYEGPWRPAVRRAVLAQRLLTYAPTGAIAAAATTSLPERVGGSKNWDYRFSWVRDTALALESLLDVRLTVECHRSFAWLRRASESTHPRLQPMYRLDGSPDLPREDVDFTGWRGSTPVRVGNDAQGQLQLGNYADFLDVALRYCHAGHLLDERTCLRCAELADRICEVWQEPDAGIWELDPEHYTQSKMAAWVTLDHAATLAAEGTLPKENRKTWERARDEIRAWVEERCWAEDRGAYVFYPGSAELDASVLLAARWGYHQADDPRFLRTIEAIRAELAEGPFLYRYSSARGDEGCFLACSFWLVDALARSDRPGEARELMDELVTAANDVGLYSEQIDPRTRDLLGNVPQALTHLSLILAAVSVMRAERATLE